MKILLVADFDYSDYNLLQYFQNGLLALGHDVARFSILPKLNSNLEDHVKFNSFNIFKKRLINNLVNNKFLLNKQKTFTDLKKIIEEFKPDFLITAKGHNLSEELLSFLHEEKIQVFNFYSDPIPYDNPLFLKMIPLYTCILTYNKDHIPGWYLLGAKKVAYLPFASDPQVHRPLSLSKDDRVKYGSPIACLATWQPYAEYWPEKLLQFGLKIWGNQWYKLPKDSPLRKVWQGEGQGINQYFPLVCQASNIVFNVVRPKNGQSHSMKTFEIPASGGFMLSNRTEDQLKFFPEDIAAVYFSTEEELLDKIKFYFKHEEKRTAISLKGLEIAQNHRYIQRMQTIVDLFKQTIKV